MKDLGLVRYDTMNRAIIECEEIDEVKDIRDKALALELYAQQAMNTDAERKACAVRLRAEKECGRRLAEMDKQHGARGVGKKVESPDTTPLSDEQLNEIDKILDMYRQGLITRDESNKRIAEIDPNWRGNSPTLADLGISKDQSSKWQKLAQVPDDEFEAALANPDKKPSTTGILKVNGSGDKMNADALWIWGRLRDMEKRNLFNCDTDLIAGEVTQAMLDDFIRMLPVAINWLSELDRSCNE